MVGVKKLSFLISTLVWRADYGTLTFDNIPTHQSEVKNIKRWIDPKHQLNFNNVQNIRDAVKNVLAEFVR